MKIAAFTMVKDESVFLPIWLRYYGAQVGYENLHVIDHGSTDGSTTALPCNNIRIPAGELDEGRRAALVSHYHAALLNYFDVVIFSDADEIVVPDPGIYSSIRDYLEKNDHDRVAGVGLALQHVREVEGDLSLVKPILHQRSYVLFHGMYCKPLISRVPMQWRPGFHGATGSYGIDLSLFLFHLKAMDYGIAHQILQSRRNLVLSQEMVDKKQGFQFKFDDDQLDKTYFRLDERATASCVDGFDFREDVLDFIKHGRHGVGRYGSLKRIPARYKNVF